jgi:CheY-like chemotaxis protein
MVLVALTGRGQPEDRRQAQAAGFDGYLVKPVVPEQLFELIARVPVSRGCD